MSNPKVAIIEEDKPIRDMYVMKFQASGFDTAGADDGAAGLALIKDFGPDLVLVDLRMPNMSGQEMLKKLREQPWGNDVLVVVLTNLSQSEASMDLRLLKVEKYIVKAYSTPSQIVQAVTEILQRYNKIKPQT